MGQSGSDNAANYVSALSSNGAITYVETAYAKEHNFPVASLMNASGNAVQPTSLNVATALEAAILHPDLTQDLTNVYTNPLPNAYPLSAYSYLVTPCSPQPGRRPERATLRRQRAGHVDLPSPRRGRPWAQFVAYLACAGQEQMATLGYSPLPPNLVQEDFNAIGRLNGGVEPPPVSAATCKNPYVDGQIPLPGEPAVRARPAADVGVAVTVRRSRRQCRRRGGRPEVGRCRRLPTGRASPGSGSGSGRAAAGIRVPAPAAGGLTAAQIAAGLPGRQRPGRQDLGLRGPGQVHCAPRLVNATKALDGVPLADLLAWILVALAIFIAIPLIGMTYGGGGARDRARLGPTQEVTS